MKWPRAGYTKDNIFGEDNSLHDDEKKIKKHIKVVTGCPSVLWYCILLTKE